MSPKTAKKYWLFKTEPHTYSFQNLVDEKKTLWTGVRNFQARNFLKQINAGDIVLIYHSGDERAVVGQAKVTREGFPEADSKRPGDWVQVEVTALKPLSRAVGLKELKAKGSLKGLLLIKQSRLSVMPLTPQEYEIIVDLGESK